jgi:hypothetical protein
VERRTRLTVAGDSVVSGWACCVWCICFVCCTSVSPLSSSSISVVSVPFEVTGEGPTISLGLKALDAAGDALRSTEFG